MADVKRREEKRREEKRREEKRREEKRREEKRREEKREKRREEERERREEKRREREESRDTLDLPGPKGAPGELERDLGQGMEGQDTGNGFHCQRAGMEGILGINSSQ
ncbi:hypothetical protein DUI87_27702 [Hirundo rustica rustica]|uniref:Uncharacterized protein n=1 Tax=Hirundo rustica rustica TaxID=333673 RepID=A0A3M0J488_HIRRU|nr:hypothetical protein DUI87_27702 [Hirundo rustica rustica]